MDFLVFNNEVLGLLQPHTRAPLLSGNDFAGLRIDVLLLQAVASFPVIWLKLTFSLREDDAG
jgi:hypothetical protein